MLPDPAKRLQARVPNGRCLRVMHHRWESLLFLHWRCSPGAIQETLPKGLSVDTFGGDAYVGIVPFFMRRVRPVGCPAMPWVSNFMELNVRTYVYDRQGVPGVWFYSLDCDQPLAVWGARVGFGLPYFHASMSAAKDAGWIDYCSRRRGTDDPARYRYRGCGAAREADPDSLEFFLLERYYLFAYRPRLGMLLRGQVSHRPYRYRAAEVEAFSTVPARLDGFGSLGSSPDHICMDDGFDIKIYGIEKVA